MLEGWLKPYKIHRRLEEREVRERLDPQVAVALPPVDCGLLKINSIFIEYVEPSFFVRGWAAMWGMLFLVGLLGIAYLFGTEALRPLQDGGLRPQDQVYFGFAVVALCSIGAVVVLKKALLKDFFAYTHYPVRFNRRDRTIYVFRGNGQDALVLPWDRAFFFLASANPIGASSSDLNMDLRCHMLSEDGTTVEQTFSAGNSHGTRAQVLQHWEMIRRYMEGGVDDLPFPPLALYVSPEPSLRNAITINVAGMGDGALRVLALPLTLPWAVCRFLALRTCRRPHWSEPVRSACRVESDDPKAQPEPAYMAQFQSEDRSAFERNMRYKLRAEKAAQEYARSSKATT